MTIYDSAKEYLNKGYVPIRVSIYYDESDHKFIKHPYNKSWQKIEKDDCLKHMKEAINMGVLTGSKSNITVIDIDTHDDGLEAWNDILESEMKGEDINTYKVLTPSGGYHYYFKYDSTIKTNRKCFKVDNKMVGIDIRNDGGCVVVPPSSQADRPYIILNDVEPIIMPEFLKKYIINEYQKPEYITINDDLLFLQEKGMAQLFTKNNCDNYKLINKNMIYKWDDYKRLWIEIDSAHIINHISDYLYKYAVEYDINLSNSLLVEFDLGKRQIIENKKKELLKILKNVNKFNICQSIYNFVYPLLKDGSFLNKINSISHLFPIKNGYIVDLKTLEKRQRQRTDYFTFESNVDLLSNNHPLTNATKFFTQIMNNDESLVPYFQKCLGYIITGETYGRCLFICYGEGSNGKSVVTDLLNNIMTDNLCVALSKKVFIKQNDNAGASPHLAKLHGKRAGFYSESSENDKLNEETIKKLTGNDIITCRKLYGDEIQFRSIIKPILMTNFKPTINASDKAIVARLKYIPFLSKFEDKPKEGEMKKDPDFIEKLKTIYKNEVFTFIARGACKFYEDGILEPPETFKKYTQEYLDENDNIMRFINDKLVKTNNDNDKIKTKDLYNIYCVWCKETNEYTLRQKLFLDELNKRNIKISNKLYDGYKVYRGYKTIKDNDDDNNDDDDDIEINNNSPLDF
jgi:P4 family phage/plasmid primase-like protien